MKHYSLELKLVAIRLFYEDGKTRPEFTERLGVRDPQQADKWLRKFRREGGTGFQRKKRGPGRPPKKENRETYIDCLEIENERFKKCHLVVRKAMLAIPNIGSSTNIKESIR